MFSFFNPLKLNVMDALDNILLNQKEPYRNILLWSAYPNGTTQREAIEINIVNLTTKLVSLELLTGKDIGEASREN